ncbi:MAG: hypothetical protein R3D57_20770 [Hyphomicrobiaceae bacterium]
MRKTLDITCYLNLAGARLRHVAGTEWSTKKYLSMEPLNDHQTTPASA